MLKNIKYKHINFDPSYFPNVCIYNINLYYFVYHLKVQTYNSAAQALPNPVIFIFFIIKQELYKNAVCTYVKNPSLTMKDSSFSYSKI